MPEWEDGSAIFGPPDSYNCTLYKCTLSDSIQRAGINDSNVVQRVESIIRDMVTTAIQSGRGNMPS